MNIKAGDDTGTETIDKLYLEWSRLTKVKTDRERRLEASVGALLLIVEGAPLPKMIDPEFYKQCAISTARRLLEDAS